MSARSIYNGREIIWNGDTWRYPSTGVPSGIWDIRFIERANKQAREFARRVNK